MEGVHKRKIEAVIPALNEEVFGDMVVMTTQLQGAFVSLDTFREQQEQKNGELSVRLTSLETENTELKARMDAIEKEMKELMKK